MTFIASCERFIRLVDERLEYSRKLLVENKSCCHDESNEDRLSPGNGSCENFIEEIEPRTEVSSDNSVGAMIRRMRGDFLVELIVPDLAHVLALAGRVERSPEIVGRDRCLLLEIDSEVCDFHFLLPREEHGNERVFGN